MAPRTGSLIKHWKNNTCQPFGGCYFESGIIVAPSNIHGLGVFTLKPIKKGTVICLFSGECANAPKQGRSDFVLEFEWCNPQTKQMEKWVLDSSEVDGKVVSACGRYANDPCSTYDKGVCPPSCVTAYTVNALFSRVLSDRPHPVIGEYYTELIAKRDIIWGEEILVEYGAPYWKRCLNYFKGHDPEIHLNSSYCDDTWMKNIL